MERREAQLPLTKFICNERGELFGKCIIRAVRIKLRKGDEQSRRLSSFQILGVAYAKERSLFWSDMQREGYVDQRTAVC